MLSNREIATLIILGIVIVYVMFSAAVRKSVGGVLKAFMHWKLQLTVWLYAIYAVGVVLAAASLGVWELALLKDSIIWIIFSGLPILFRAPDVKDGSLLIKRTLAETFGVSVIVGFYVNLRSFSIPLEIVLQIFLFCLIMVGVAAGRQDDKARSVNNIANFLIAGIGIFLVWTTISWLAQNWKSVDLELWLLAAMTLWFPLALLPFIYVAAFIMHCESAVSRLAFFNDGKPPTLGVHVGYLIGTRGSAKYASGVKGHWRAELARARGFRQAVAVMAAFRQSIRDEEKAQKQAVLRLKEYAGVKGVDEYGRQLDRREFDETQRALEYLWNCMLGHARNRKGKYRHDMLECGFDFGRFGLPEGEDHGIRLEVADDRRSWFGWRRTITGWVFAIGGNRQDRTIQWIYDGAEPPSELPDGKNGIWCDGIISSAAAPNWRAVSSSQDVA